MQDLTHTYRRRSAAGGRDIGQAMVAAAAAYYGAGGYGRGRGELGWQTGGFSGGSSRGGLGGRGGGFGAGNLQPKLAHYSAESVLLAD